MTTPAELLSRYSSQSQVSSFFKDFMGLVSVKSFGAKGDGITDDTNAILDCINYSTANGFIAMFFPHGTYKVRAGELGTPLTGFFLWGDNTTVIGDDITINQIGLNMTTYNDRFTGLIDAPAAFTGYSGKVLAVNETENGIEFIDLRLTLFATKDELAAAVISGLAPNSITDTYLKQTGNNILPNFNAHLADSALYVYPTQTTAQIQTALNTGRDIVFTSGTYTIGQLTFPSTIKSVSTIGFVKLIPDGTVPSGVTAAEWLYFLTMTDATIQGFTIDVNTSTFPNLRCISFANCVNTVVQKIKAFNGGGIAIYTANCSNMTISRIRIKSFAYKGISVDGTTTSQNSDNLIENNYVDGTGTAHCISTQNGNNITVLNNYCANAITFGVGFNNVVFGKIKNNTTYNTIHEGINIEDSQEILIGDNICKWDIGTGTDFGISVYGNAITTQFNEIQNNLVVNSNASGIAICDIANLNSVIGNTVINCNRGNIANHCGILLYGTSCTKNVISKNIVTDLVGTLHKYGIGEINFGTGAPTNNEITGNRIEGFVTADIVTTNSTTNVGDNKKDLDGYRTYTPTVTPGTGAITSYTANGYYLRKGKIVSFFITITLTNNGTGGAELRATLPFSAVAGLGMAHGKEIATSGTALTGEIGSSAVVIRKYDNTYPGVTSSVINIKGEYQIA